MSRRRESGHNLARCNSTLFTDEGGATLELCQETAASFGVLGDASTPKLACAHCSALLFKREGARYEMTNGSPHLSRQRPVLRACIALKADLGWFGGEQEKCMQIASSDPHADPHSETRIHWIANLITVLVFTAGSVTACGITANMLVEDL